MFSQNFLQNLPKLFYKKPKHARAQWILMSQAVDHSVVLMFLFAMMLPALTAFEAPVIKLFVDAGNSFWLGLFTLWFFLGLIYRSLAVTLYGKTFGQFLMGTHYKHLDKQLDAHTNNSSGKLNALFYGELALESLHIALPPLWILDYVKRVQNQELFPHYTFNYAQAFKSAQYENTLLD